MLAYGIMVYVIDECYWLAKNMTIEHMKLFVHIVITFFQPRYMKEPMKLDIKNQLKGNVKRGFLGMCVSFNCMHYS
jgi:hypothetical protein